ncbi:hypothetical protein [Pseudooceanicola sediminis]|uniref:hypothetical protein n=1 Tax=Pseudooceanicola sediminis TaxID=2211117 RepID=UPI002AA5465A|nr:hypothetical protein [Pseudooceanicola sediminis]|tara:strand:+ start:34682 stop:35104 length:423 start_codon:yes stop_codon:yes gene_type:complete
MDVDRSEGPIAFPRGLVEKPEPAQAPSRLAVVGRYILEPSIFARLSETRPGAGGEIQRIDAINADAATGVITGLRFRGERFDCGSVAGYLAATLAHAMQRADVGPAVAAAMRRHLAHVRPGCSLHPEHPSGSARSLQGVA